ncbi:MAG: type II toxin-antitoxin system RelE/ParE family toxin [Alphaproteobacteria bacterium]|nr:type II toxin-antitoxin system RelE/ParE family toxin [Alphaproteobacteria bacterium]
MTTSNGISGWTIEVERRARRDLRKITARARKAILDFIVYELPGFNHPRQRGQALKGVMTGLWRYRVGDYRIVARIEDHQRIVAIVTIGHRSSVYPALLRRLS